MTNLPAANKTGHSHFTSLLSLEFTSKARDIITETYTTLKTSCPRLCPRCNTASKIRKHIHKHKPGYIAYMHSPLHSYSKKALATEENIWGITSKQQIMSKSKGENLDTHILKRRDLFDFQPNFSCFMSIIISTQLLKQLWSSSEIPRVNEGIHTRWSDEKPSISGWILVHVQTQIISK